ncbi:hypothetical protein B0H10DRAFT_2234196 [Mycena sp. CBHHK59/15]|nr:hypothetical protein B0H10DRAFT_2234196 [Mycena sp. CBHHK59/15]
MSLRTVTNSFPSSVGCITDTSAYRIPVRLLIACSPLRPFQQRAGGDWAVRDAARGDTLSPPTSGSVSAAAANAGHPIACDPASHRESHPALRAPLCVCPGNAGGLGQEGGEGDELDGSRLLVPISDLRVPREGAGDTYVPQSQRPCPARPPRTEPMIARASSPGVAVRRARGRLHFVPSATSERRGTNVWTDIGNRSCWSTGMRDAGEVPQVRVAYRLSRFEDSSRPHVAVDAVHVHSGPERGGQAGRWMPLVAVTRGVEFGMWKRRTMEAWFSLM